MKLRISFISKYNRGGKRISPPPKNISIIIIYNNEQNWIQFSTFHHNLRLLHFNR